MPNETLGRFEQVLRFASSRGIAAIHIKPGQRPLYRRCGTLISRKDEQTFSEADLDEIAHGLVPGAWLPNWAAGFDVTFPHGVVGCGRFRLTLLHQRGAVGVVVHVLPGKAQTLREANLPKVMANWAHLARGLVLLSGPPGSGRSVTWQALIEQVNTAGVAPRHVITLENPIEVLFDDKLAFIRQREIVTDTADLATGLQQIARMDCDIVAIGDLPPDHVESALALAEQGRLVIAVVAGGAPVELIRQLLAQREPARRDSLRQRLAAQLRGIAYQKLVVTADGKARVPAVEVATFVPQMLEVVRGAADVAALQPFIEQGRATGNQTLEQSLIELAHQGMIAVDQALAASDSPDALRHRIASTTQSGMTSTVTPVARLDEVPF